jgi:hypothetical protein
MTLEARKARYRRMYHFSRWLRGFKFLRLDRTGLPKDAWSLTGSLTRPTYWLDVVLWWVWPWHWSQCGAGKEYQGGLVISYCLRRKGHPGRHTTNCGDRF